MYVCHDHGNIYHQYTPVLLSYVYHTWIPYIPYIKINRDRDVQDIST